MSWGDLAKELKISDRQLRDIRNGIYSLPDHIAEAINKRFNLDLPKDYSIKQDLWFLSKASSLGGKRRFELHGSPATPEGRRKGGFNSIKTHIIRNNGFKISKIISVPKDTVKLAEFIGILAGDGNLSLWQTKISLSLRTEMIYARYVGQLIDDLFDLKASLYEREYSSTIDVVVSSNRFVQFLHSKGVPIGNKIAQNLDIPKWIYKREGWKTAYLKGLFDTDGCTYVDSHRYKDKGYKHICIAFTIYSKKLLGSVCNLLQNLGYSPTISSGRNVLLRRKEDVLRFFQEIKPNNKNHVYRLKIFMEEYRSGYNEIASKAIVAVR